MLATKQLQRVQAQKPMGVVCKAQNSVQVAEVAKKASAAAISTAALLQTHPALALVDDRMNGDGTGLPFGINDGVLGWVIAGTLGTIWAIYFTSQKDLGDFEDPDAGLRISDDE